MQGSHVNQIVAIYVCCAFACLSTLNCSKIRPINQGGPLLEALVPSSSDRRRDQADQSRYTHNEIGESRAVRGKRRC